jgi:hypothetical protein
MPTRYLQCGRVRGCCKSSGQGTGDGSGSRGSGGSRSGGSARASGRGGSRRSSSGGRGLAWTHTHTQHRHNTRPRTKTGAPPSKPITNINATTRSYTYVRFLAYKKNPDNNTHMQICTKKGEAGHRTNERDNAAKYVGEGGNINVRETRGGGGVGGVWGGDVGHTAVPSR